MDYCATVDICTSIDVYLADSTRGHVVAVIRQTARNILNETKKEQFNSKGWSRREELHQGIVNGIVGALNNKG